MTQREFSELTGKNINADNFMDEYTMADRVYMAATSLDKQTFCADYKKHGLTPTVCALTEKVELEEKWSIRKTKIMVEAAESILDIIATMDPETADAKSLYQQAIKLITQKECVKYKVERGFALSQRDKEFIISAINQK